MRSGLDWNDRELDIYCPDCGRAPDEKHTIWCELGGADADARAEWWYSDLSEDLDIAGIEGLVDTGEVGVDGDGQ